MTHISLTENLFGLLQKNRGFTRGGPFSVRGSLKPENQPGVSLPMH